MEIDEENAEYLNKIHPYSIKHEPTSYLQALFSSRNRLLVGELYKTSMKKCKFQNETLYDKETIDKISFDENTFKNMDQIDVHCFFKINNMLRGRFLKQEWELLDCLEECETKFPNDHFKYIDFYIFKRIPCNRRCEDAFNEKTREKVLKIQEEINNRDFKYIKGETVILK